MNDGHDIRVPNIDAARDGTRCEDVRNAWASVFCECACGHYGGLACLGYAAASRTAKPMVVDVGVEIRFLGQPLVAESQSRSLRSMRPGSTRRSFRRTRCGWWRACSTGRTTIGPPTSTRAPGSSRRPWHRRSPTPNCTPASSGCPSIRQWRPSTGRTGGPRCRPRPPNACGTAILYAPSMDHRRDELVFLVRMWHETDSAAESAWRGSVHEIGNGRRFYVTAPDEIAAFMATALRREPHEGEKS
jgi:hypothetical protein